MTILNKFLLGTALLVGANSCNTKPTEPCPGTRTSKLNLEAGLVGMTIDSLRTDGHFELSADEVNNFLLPKNEESEVTTYTIFKREIDGSLHNPRVETCLCVQNTADSTSGVAVLEGDIIVEKTLKTSPVIQ